MNSLEFGKSLSLWDESGNRYTLTVPGVRQDGVITVGHGGIITGYQPVSSVVKEYIGREELGGSKGIKLGEGHELYKTVLDGHYAALAKGHATDNSKAYVIGQDGKEKALPPQDGDLLHKTANDYLDRKAARYRRICGYKN